MCAVMLPTQPRPRSVLGFAENCRVGRDVCYVINVPYCLENAFVSCRVCILLGDLLPDLTRGLQLGDPCAHKKVNTNDIPQLCIHGCNIDRVTKFKLLGVFISSDLSWNSHVTYMLQKVAK